MCIRRCHTSENNHFHSILGMGLGRSQDLVMWIWMQLANGVGDFQGRPMEASMANGVSALNPQDPLWGQTG